MSIEKSRVNRVDRNNGRDLGELRNAVLAFSGAAKLDDELTMEAAQRVVDAMRDEIHGQLASQPNAQQERYYREVLKTVDKVSAGRLVLPVYDEVLNGSSEDSDVSLSGKRQSVRPAGQGSVSGGSSYRA